MASDTEDIINITLTVDGTEVAVILVEQSSGLFKLSLRSRSEVDCSKLAEMFQGGGHKGRPAPRWTGRAVRPIAGARSRPCRNE